MTDIDPGVTDAPEASPDPTPVDTSTDPFDPTDGEAVQTPAGEKVFTESYVKRLRDEAAKHRVEAKSVKEQFKAFEGLDPDDFGWFASAASTYKDGGLDALVKYAEPLYADLIQAGATPEQAQEIVEAVVEEATEEKPLTAKDLDKVLSEREKAKADEAAKTAEQQKTIEHIRTVMSDAGYEVGSDRGDWVLSYAASKGTKIEAAIEAHKAYEQSIIDAYVSSKKSGAKTVNGTSGEQNPVEPRSIDEAARMARDFIRSQAAAG